MRVLLGRRDDPLLELYARQLVEKIKYEGARMCGGMFGVLHVNDPTPAGLTSLKFLWMWCVHMWCPVRCPESPSCWVWLFDQSTAMWKRCAWC